MHLEWDDRRLPVAAGGRQRRRRHRADVHDRDPEPRQLHARRQAAPDRVRSALRVHVADGQVRRWQPYPRRVRDGRRHHDAGDHLRRHDQPRRRRTAAARRVRAPSGHHTARGPAVHAGRRRRRRGRRDVRNRRHRHDRVMVAEHDAVPRRRLRQRHDRRVLQLVRPGHASVVRPLQVDHQSGHRQPRVRVASSAPTRWATAGTGEPAPRTCTPSTSRAGT